MGILLCVSVNYTTSTQTFQFLFYRVIHHSLESVDSDHHRHAKVLCVLYLLLHVAAALLQQLQVLNANTHTTLILCITRVGIKVKTAYDGSGASYKLIDPKSPDDKPQLINKQ